MQGSKTLEEIVTNLRSQTSTTKRAVVVIDAGIATEENLDILRKNDFDYVCVSRSKLKDYKIDPSYSPVEKGLSIISSSLSKKSGIKTEEKVYERIGRLKQKYPSVAKYYEICFDGFSKLLR
jgi:hypothetical protein